MSDDLVRAIVPAVVAETDRLKAEIEQVRAENEALVATLKEPDQVGYWQRRHELAEAEIERLRAEYPYSELDMDMHVEAVTRELRLKQRMIDYWGKRVEKAEAEAERLRAALQAICDAAIYNEKLIPENIVEFARRALEGREDKK